ncbi:MAG: lysine--tRNA ligase [Candidatus Saccharibacteria bacterium]|nr:lysine--tRNA ligase [Candidatus Saccharibacteria bacterium]
MRWLSSLVDQIIAEHPSGEILIESGGSPSGTYHLGHMRELVICDAILLELRNRGREAKHIYFVDDLDIFRKVPIDMPTDFDQYLGRPLCDVPSPDGNSDKSYADHILQGLIDSCSALGVEVEFVRTHPKYRSGWFNDAIELALGHVPQIKNALETISNRKLDENWSPIQVLENGRLKNRKFLSIDPNNKTVTFEDSDGQPQNAHYDIGEVKLDWRIDWPARWWMLKVAVEPFGREHASAGGSYDTGVQIMKDVFKAPPPIPVPYDSIHMFGDNKKMSASKGTAVSAQQGTEVMPAEVIRYFMLRSPLNRPLFFDPVDGVVKLIDEFASLVAQTELSLEDQMLINISTRGNSSKTVSRVPFSHLLASYQAALFDVDLTLEIISRTEYATVAREDDVIIKNELTFIEAWLKKWAPEDVKFTLKDSVDANSFTKVEQDYLIALAAKIKTAPNDANGEWFHKAIYDFKDQVELPAKDLFTVLYRAIIGKTYGPRVGWFLSILPRDWLIKRLRFEA